jgi:hypothetical protein
MDKQFADRRYKVQSARTYFYLNEAQCERNLEIFHECLEAVSGKRDEHQLSNIIMKSPYVLSDTLVHSRPHILHRGTLAKTLAFVLVVQETVRVWVDQGAMLWVCS